jgi:hypothetical protein
VPCDAWKLVIVVSASADPPHFQTWQKPIPKKLAPPSPYKWTKNTQHWDCCNKQQQDHLSGCNREKTEVCVPRRGENEQRPIVTIFLPILGSS